MGVEQTRQRMKYVGAGLTGVALLLVCIGMALESSWYGDVTISSIEMSLRFGVTKQVVKQGDNEKSTTFLTDSCDQNNNSDNMKKCCTSAKAGFAMDIIGIFFNFILVLSFVLPQLENIAGRKLPLILSVLAFIFYLISWALAYGACKDAMKDISDQINGLSIDLSITFYMILVADILVLFALGPAFMFSKEAPQASAADEPAVVVEAENPVADQPEGAVYMKNGTWMDKDDNPVATKA